MNIVKSEKIVFAWRAVLGSLIGAPLADIPMTKLFFGGSDDDLRGYKYRTVSPTNNKGDPKGGRSAIYLSFEPRLRITQTIGVVPFTDWGVVTTKQYPTPFGKWYKSAGIGFRYYTFFGPMRLDIAFPLNQRKIDHWFRFYASIGQTF